MNLDNQISNDVEEKIEKYSANRKKRRVENLQERQEYEKHKHILENKTKIFNVWEKVQEANTKIRSDYAKKLFWLLVGQLIFLNVIVLISVIFSNDIEFKKWLVISVGIKTFIEVVGFVTIVINYLFKPINKEMESLLGQLDGERNKKELE